jgi:hypothetical protein
MTNIKDKIEVQQPVSTQSFAALVWSPNVAIDAELKRQLPSVDVWNGRLSAIPDLIQSLVVVPMV